MPAAKPTARKKLGREVEKDAISLLKQDHGRVRGLLDELEQTTDKAASKWEQFLAAIEQELKVHTKIEEVLSGAPCRRGGVGDVAPILWPGWHPRQAGRASALLADGPGGIPRRGDSTDRCV